MNILPDSGLFYIIVIRKSSFFLGTVGTDRLNTQQHNVQYLLNKIHFSGGVKIVSKGLVMKGLSKSFITLCVGLCQLLSPGDR